MVLTLHAGWARLVPLMINGRHRKEVGAGKLLFWLVDVGSGGNLIDHVVEGFAHRSRSLSI